jgi:thioredoxin reductase (NADPH)
MSQYLVDRIESAPNIDVLLRTEILRAEGEGHLEQLVLGNVDTGEETTAATSGLFIFIGAAPHSDFLDGVVRRTSRGFVLTGPDLQIDGEWPPEWPLERDPFPLETSVPGIFAAGDVKEGAVRRVATAVGQGAVAVSLVHQYLATI